MDKIEVLQQMIDERMKIVFLAEQVFQQKAESRISEAWTGFIIKNMIIRRRRYSAIPFYEKAGGVLSVLQG